MPFGKPSPFAYSGRVFAASDAPVLTKIPPVPETHEPRKRPRSYLAASDLTDQLARALSGTMPDPRPMPHKVVVERVRQVPTVPTAQEA